MDYENIALSQGYDIIVGIDEAGRGPLAGPVVAAAVYLKSRDFAASIKDSKKLSPRQREMAYQEIVKKSYYGVGIVGPEVIDRINILQATFVAMTKAVDDLLDKFAQDGFLANGKKLMLLIDGNRFESKLAHSFKTIIKGDQTILPIMCASIIAKVTRDRIMDEYDKKYPQYGFLKHKGYPTKLHKGAIKSFGFSEIHRKTFKV